MKVTIQKSFNSHELSYITLDAALNRIKTGKSSELVLQIKEIQSQIEREKDEQLKSKLSEKKSELKLQLPCICFSGIFAPKRQDSDLKEHSGFVILDFDHVDVASTKSELFTNDYIYACWTSPSGDGVKALVRISNPEKHREHYKSLLLIFPTLDKKNINPSRVCFESFDPEIYINYESKVFTNYTEEVVEKVALTSNENIEIVSKWMENSGELFTSGNRNNYVFKFASACCRFGIPENECSFKLLDLQSSGFGSKEIKQTIKSAYKKNTFGTVVLVKDNMVETETGEVINLDSLDFQPYDFVDDKINEILDLYDNGHESIKELNIDEINRICKFKRGEISLFSGYGNQGKSSFVRWLLLLRAIQLGEKFALFAPEDAPSEEFFFALAETMVGGSLLPHNQNRKSKDEVKEVLKFLHSHFIIVNCKDLAPTPEFIKETFFKLIVQEGIDGIVIDPFNQLANDYKNGRDDKYLETFLSDFSKFSKDNKVYGIIIAHPKTPKEKDKDGNYPCPDVFDLAMGSMWNNKMDDIFIYNRPNSFSNPESTECELHAKKIRRQWKADKGYITFNYNRITKRYIFDGYDPMGTAPRKENFFD